MKNIDYIKSLDVEDMAEFIKCDDCYYCPVTCCKFWNEGETYSDELCKKYAMQWLNEERSK